jgi:hypothetical protein
MFYTSGIQAPSLSTGNQEIRDTLYWKTDMAFGILNAPSVDGMILKCEISGSCEDCLWRCNAI